MARMVATKASLSIRVDALSDAESRSDPQAAEVGITNRVKLESRLRALEHQAGIVSTRRTTAGAGRQQPKFEMTSNGNGTYNNATDSVRQMLPTQPAGVVEKAVAAVVEVKEEKRQERSEEEKERKKKRKSEVGDVSMAGDESMVAGETKEERKARKAAKKAVSYFCSHEV
jgi:nucleolar protein 58